MKKGYIFTLDAFLAIGIIIMGMIIIYSANSFLPSSQQTMSYAEDTSLLFTTSNIEDLNDAYLNQLFQWGIIKNKKNSLLEQVGEFYFLANLTNNVPINYSYYNYEMLRRLTESLVQPQFGVGFYVNGNPVYERVNTNKTVKVLLANKMPVVGIYNTTTLWGPYLIEVRVWQ